MTQSWAGATASPDAAIASSRNAGVLERDQVGQDHADADRDPRAIARFNAAKAHIRKRRDRQEEREHADAGVRIEDERRSEEDDRPARHRRDAKDDEGDGEEREELVRVKQHPRLDYGT